MVKYKISYTREDCIGAGTCEAVAPTLFKLNQDAKADLLNSTKNLETGKWELIIDEKDLDLAKEAASVCPVFVINVEEIKDKASQDTLKESNTKKDENEKYAKLFIH